MPLKTGTWAAKANITSSRSNPGYVVYNNNLHIIGGHSISASSSHYAYDPSSNTWSTKASLQVARYDLGCCEVSGKLYAIGGHTGDGTYKTENECYDPVANSWSYKTAMPTGREDLGVVAVNGLIYCIGGASGSYLKKNECFDPVANSWSAKADMPTARNSFAIASVGSKIYVIGGLNGNFLNTVECYDTTTNTWSTKSPMPTPRRHCRSVAIGNLIYVIGGYNNTLETNINNESLKTVEVYDTVLDKWFTGFAGLINSRDRFGIGVINGIICAATGWQGDSEWYTATVEAYDPNGGSYIFTPLTNLTLPSLNNLAKENIDYLRTKVNEFRVANGLSSYVFTDPTIVKGSTPIRAIHMNEIQSAINAVYQQTGETYIDTQTDITIKQTVVSKKTQIDNASRMYYIMKALRRQ